MRPDLPKHGQARGVARPGRSGREAPEAKRNLCVRCRFFTPWRGFWTSAGPSRTTENYNASWAGMQEDVRPRVIVS